LDNLSHLSTAYSYLMNFKNSMQKHMDGNEQLEGKSILFENDCKHYLNKTIAKLLVTERTISLYQRAG
jgi:hypothetical protein